MSLAWGRTAGANAAGTLVHSGLMLPTHTGIFDGEFTKHSVSRDSQRRDFGNRVGWAPDGVMLFFAKKKGLGLGGDPQHSGPVRVMRRVVKHSRYDAAWGRVGFGLEAGGAHEVVGGRGVPSFPM